MRYKALLIDFYGTIASGDAEVVHAACNRLVADFGLEVTAHELAAAWGNAFFNIIESANGPDFKSLYECEYDSLVETMSPMRGRIDPEPYVRQLVDYWRAPSLHEDAIESLSKLHVPVCCVSNADTGDLHCAVGSHRLCFDAVVTSEDARSYKPNGRIFESALTMMNAAPHEVLHVGDSLHSDVGGANALGIDSAWLIRERRIHDIGRAFATHNLLSLNDLRLILE